MHENYLAENLAKIILDQATKNQAKGVKKVTLVLDKKDHLKPENLKYLLLEYLKNTLAQNTVLDFKQGDSTYIENIQLEVD